MDSQEFRSLSEAYLEVYQLDEEETGRGPRLIDTYDKPPYSDKVKDAPKYKPVIKGPKRKGVIKKEEVDLTTSFFHTYLMKVMPKHQKQQKSLWQI